MRKKTLYPKRSSKDTFHSFVRSSVRRSFVRLLIRLLLGTSFILSLELLQQVHSICTNLSLLGAGSAEDISGLIHLYCGLCVQLPCHIWPSKPGKFRIFLTLFKGIVSRDEYFLRRS